MLSRHFLRSKVLQALYAAKADPVELNVVEKNFKHQISRLNDLGTIQLAALVHFAEFSGTIMDEAQHKYLPTEEELNPIRRIPENIFILRLADNFDLRRHSEDANVNWGGVDYDQVFRQAYASLVKLPEYKDYLASEPSFDTDQKFALNLFKFLMNYEPFRDILYPQSLLWEDDFDQIAQYNFMMLKSLDDTTDEATPIPLMHDDRFEKDSEAFEFSRNLLLASMRHFSEVEKMIRDHLNGWEYERVALMDILMLNMAVAEFTEFPSIPERVTVDEYIELSKEFSTERSKLFINGILDKFIVELRSAGRINKVGRGLLDPTLFGTEDSDSSYYSDPNVANIHIRDNN
jgi:N utilization substance protein B